MLFPRALALTLLVVLARDACAQLQPKTYTSPSGGWSLRVEPQERSGTGVAEYVLTRDGREAWRKQQPFALSDAFVTDDGRVAGYAYSGAEEQAWSGGTLRIVALSPTGDIVLDEAHEREGSNREHASGIPRALGMLAQPELGRFVVRVDHDEGEEWWIYDLASGQSLPQDRPRSESNSPLLAVRAIPGTPLVLLNQIIFNTAPTEFGGSFRLVDENWKVVWELALPHDFEAGGDEHEQDRIRNAMFADSAVLATAAKSFDLRFVAERERVTFGVERDGEGWKVTERARVPYPAPAAPIEIPTRTLTLGRRVPLEAPPAPGAEIRDILAFGFDAHSQLRFVRKEGEGGAVSLVLLDASGTVLRATRVPEFMGQDKADWFPLPGERWLAISESHDHDIPTRVHLVRESDGDAIRVAGFSGQSVKGVAALGTNAFVLLGTWESRYTSRAGLLAIDLTGYVRWEVMEDYEDETKLFSPEGVTVTTDGRVVVLDNIRDQLQVYSSSGKFLRTVDLTSAWGLKPEYPSGIHADRDGGVLVHDFEGKPPLYRMSRENAVIASFDVRRADGTSLDDYRRHAQVAPDGRVWTTDRHEFLRMDESGRVDLELGTAERIDALEDPGFACIESLFGRVLIHDRRTHAVHVFDGEGRRVTLCRPKPEEREKLDFPMALAAAPDGSVYVGDSKYDPRPLHFAADGTSLGFLACKATNIAFQPSGGSYLGVGHSAVRLMSSEQKRLGEITKRPDGQWFRSIGDLALATEGSFAVLDVPASGGPGRAPGTDDACVALFGPQGEPQRQFSVPAGVRHQEIAYQGGRVLLKDWENAWCMDASNGSTVALSITEPACAFGLSPDGSELWAVAKDGRSLLRYALAP